MQNRVDTVSPIVPFDLNALRKITPAVVYAFDTEISAQQLSPMNEIFYVAGQYQDTYNAYLYAQDTILSDIQQNGMRSITEEKILVWLDQIHQRIAATLAKDVRMRSGTYTDRPVMRWSNAAIRDKIGSYLAGEIDKKTLWDQCRLLDVNFESAKRFVKLIEEIAKRDVAIPDSEKAHIDRYSSGANVAVTFGKLITLYHGNALSEGQKSIVDDFLTICMPPDRMRPAMETYAKELAIKLHGCNSSNINEVVNVVYDAFYGLTEIHPYFNGNGRTGTCWANALLCGFGYPSILLRYPQECNKPDSTYSKAIKHITTKPDLMRAHLKERIETAKNGNAYKNDELRDLVILRVKTTHLLCAIKDKYAYSTADLEKLYNRMLMAAYMQLPKEVDIDISNIRKSYSDKLSLLYSGLMVAECEKMLLKAPAVKPSGLQNLSISQPKYDAQTKARIVNQLKSLIGNQDGEWKIYSNPKENNLVAHLNLDTVEVEASKNVIAISDTINWQQTVKITSGMNKKINKQVVSFEILDPNKLLKINPVITSTLTV